MEYLQVILSFAMKTKNAWKVFPNAHSKFAPPGYSTKHSLNRLPYSDRPTKSFLPVKLRTSRHTNLPRALTIDLRLSKRPFKNFKNLLNIMFLACFPLASLSTSQHCVALGMSNMTLTFTLKLLQSCWNISEEKCLNRRNEPNRF